MTTLFLTFAVFGMMMCFLGLGLFFGRRGLRGSCASSRRPPIGHGGETLMCPRCECDSKKRNQGAKCAHPS